MTYVKVHTAPFPHTTGGGALTSKDADRTLKWMIQSAPWRLKIASFYEQWELPLDVDVLPPELRHLSEIDFVTFLERRFLGPISDRPLCLSEITAHKLVRGQTIRIHNDFIKGQESHRLLVQLNGGWKDEQGGLLLLFGSSSNSDIRRIIRPLHGSGFGFEISPHSLHAVSTIHEGERFTLVYSFKSLEIGPDVVG